MSNTCRVALLGFNDFERITLASYFRLAARGDVVYEFVAAGDDSAFVLADADHAPSVQLVLATDRQAQTLFIGSHPPAGARAWTMRPIDPLQVARELDALRLQAAGAAAQPVAAPAAAPLAAVASRDGRPAGAPLLRPSAVPAPSALLVDDSAIALRFLETRLRPWGLAVECVDRSDRALERLARRHYDFVFVDVELGADSELDGLALCQQIRRQHPLAASTLVMVSAHQGELDRVRGMLAGCDAYLGKPLDAAELERLLARQGLRRAPGGAAAPGAGA